MTALSSDAIRHFRDQGYFAPIRVLAAGEAAALRGHLEAYELIDGTLKGPLRHKSHLLFTWLDALIREPRILDAVEELIGPNILCWASSFFIKEPHDPSFVSWHQDSTYWGLEPPDIVTAWIAFSESVAANGAMRLIPGSHKLDQIPHRDTFAANNLLSRGQEIEVEVDEARAVMLELEPGEMSVHHVRLVHGSDPNPSARRRIGFAIRYLPTYVRQIVGGHDTATLVRGVDRFQNFEPEHAPRTDMDPAAVAYHAQVTGALSKILMRDTDRHMRA